MNKYIKSQEKLSQYTSSKLPPCKVGDVLYELCWMGRYLQYYVVREIKVKSINILEDHWELSTDNGTVVEEDFGYVVFFNQDDANVALKETR